MNAITTAVHDTENRPSVLFITWGKPECQWAEQTRNVIDSALQDAVASGITVFAESSDAGSSDGIQDGNEHVDYPASSPWVTSCGGTKLVLSNSSIISETSWNNTNSLASGGGVSICYPLPALSAPFDVL
jgi:kumamolisin